VGQAKEDGGGGEGQEEQDGQGKLRGQH